MWNACPPGAMLVIALALAAGCSGAPADDGAQAEEELATQGRRVPGTIQAEAFDVGGEGVGYHDVDARNIGDAYRVHEGVDLQATSDQGGGYDVGWIRAGEWLKYTVDVASTASYDLGLRVAAPSAGGTIRLEVDGAPATDPIVVPATGGWQEWTTLHVSGVDLKAGTRALTLVFDGGSVICNLNSFTLEASASPPKPPPSAGGIKWHPGHYFFDQGSVTTALSSNAIAGIAVMYYWGGRTPALQRDDGAYDFSGIEAALQRGRAKGKRLHLIVVDQDYHGHDCVPAYMRTDPKFEGGQVKQGNRCVAKVWVPAVMDELIKLYKALGKRFDPEPDFEAISTGEISFPGADGNLGGEVLRLAQALPGAFPHTLASVMANWAPNECALIREIYSLGLGLDGPDTIPGKIDSLPGTGANAGCYMLGPHTVQGEKQMHMTFGYPYYPAYHHKIPLAINGQNGLINAVLDKITVPEIFDFVTRNADGLRVNHMVWNEPYNTGLTFKGDVLPYIESQRSYIDQTCPENIVRFRGGCNTH